MGFYSGKYDKGKGDFTEYDHVKYPGNSERLQKTLPSHLLAPEEGTIQELINPGIDQRHMRHANGPRSEGLSTLYFQKNVGNPNRIDETDKLHKALVNAIEHSGQVYTPDPYDGGAASTTKANRLPQHLQSPHMFVDRAALGILKEESYLKDENCGVVLLKDRLATVDPSDPMHCLNYPKSAGPLRERIVEKALSNGPLAMNAACAFLQYDVDDSIPHYNEYVRRVAEFNEAVLCLWRNGGAKNNKRQTLKLSLQLQNDIPNVFAGLLNAASVHRQDPDESWNSQVIQHVDPFGRIVVFHQLDGVSYNFIACYGKEKVPTFSGDYVQYLKYKDSQDEREKVKLTAFEDSFKKEAAARHMNDIKIFKLEKSDEVCFDASLYWHATVVPKQAKGVH
ncbi:MAG: hypothetical protein SGARI_001297, partial [Bacillariaceae sp.]